MLRSAIERSPEDLQIILPQVIQLPQRKQEELAKLLREASLSAIISAAKIVADPAEVPVRARFHRFRSRNEEAAQGTDPAPQDPCRRHLDFRGGVQPIRQRQSAIQWKYDPQKNSSSASGLKKRLRCTKYLGPAIWTQSTIRPELPMVKLDNFRTGGQHTNSFFDDQA